MQRPEASNSQHPTDKKSFMEELHRGDVRMSTSAHIYRIQIGILMMQIRLYTHTTSKDR